MRASKQLERRVDPESVADEISHWLETSSLTLQRVARGACVPLGDLERMASRESLKGMAHRQEKMDRVAVFLDHAEETGSGQVWQPVFAETAAAKQVFRLLDRSERTGAMQIILGQSGAGKSTAAEEWIRRRQIEWDRPLQGEIVRASGRPRAGVKAFLWSVAGECGCSRRSKNATVILQSRIEAWMQNRGALLIVDEADWVDENSFQSLRQAWDMAEGCGLVWLGTPDWVSRLRASRSDTGTVEQFLSRAGVFWKLQGATKNDLAEVFSDLDLAEKALEILAEGAGGDIRRAVHAVQIASDLGDGDLSPEAVAQAFKGLVPQERGR